MEAKDQEDLIRNLGLWLELLDLGHYLDQAKEWCHEMGAAEMEEVRENWEEFAAHLGLSGEEWESLAEACQPQNLQILLPAAKSRETFGDEQMPYVMQEKLGQGATATVYRCKRGDEEFAVKVIDLHRFSLHQSYEKMRHHIMREMSLLLMLQHRNIVKFIAFEEAPHTIFLVMELIRGGDLSEYLLQMPNGHMDDKEACHVFLQIVDGLMHIHSKNIVHRDLKPQNILLAEPPEDVTSSARRSKAKPIEVKLSDFGHSKLVRDGYTNARSHVGTPQYLAPEVASTLARYDERADLWSLGVVLYVMLTGHYPFNSSEDPAYRQGSFKFRGSGCSGRAEELLAGLIKRRPEDRLSLEQCLRSAWVSSFSEKKQRQPAVCPLIPENHTKEFRIRLPRAPKNVSSFKQELDTFSLRHKLSASLLILEVVVNFNSDVSEELMEAARSELWDILHRYCPALKRSNMFPGEAASGTSSPHGADNANPMVQEEHEVLSSIYGPDFEALSDWEWLVNVGHGTFLRVKLPAGYPTLEAPMVQVECPHGTAPNVQQDLEDCWSPGSVCVFQMVEILEKAVKDTVKEGSEDTSTETTPVMPVPAVVECDVQICHSATLVDRKSLFQAHLAKVHSMKEVVCAREQLLADRRINGATHNVVAYRFRQRRPNLLVEECHDGGEAGAGKHLLDLLVMRGDLGVFIMVSRWRGCIHLGSDRFKNYQRVAQQLLERPCEAS